MPFGEESADEPPGPKTLPGQLTSLSLESIHNVERGDCLALGMFRVRDRITDDTLEEGLEHTTGLFVDHWRADMLEGQT